MIERQDQEIANLKLNVEEIKEIRASGGNPKKVVVGGMRNIYGSKSPP